MKKTLIFLLILAVAGGVFAQDLKLTGEAKMGLGVRYDTSSEEAHLIPFGRDSEQGVHFRLNGAYATEGDTAGVKFRLQQRAEFTVPYAFGYVNVFNNLLTLQGGLIDDGTFNSGGGILDSDAGEGVGTNILVKPIEGLVIGGGAYAASGVGHLKSLPKLGDAKYTAGFSYAMPDLFKIVTSFRTKNWIQGTENLGESVLNEQNQLIVGANILALSNMGLNLVLEGRFTSLGEDKELDIDGFATIGYAKDALSAGLNFALYQADINADDVPDPIIAFWLYGSYAVSDNIVPRLDVAIKLNDTTITDGYKWHHKHFTRNADATGDPDQMLLSFKPAVLLKIDANNSIEIGDQLSVQLNKDKGYGPKLDKDSNIVNSFYIDYVFKF
ncbi:MAG: hypothetical protein LBP76_10070 [Treponema sp.]|jgi:hypothetical protein|nr:hypothetical protein [Treponema sp.]